METLSFTATTAGIDTDFALVAALGTDDPALYVMFQGDAEDDAEDGGIHFEFNDQMNGANECIHHCTLSRRRLQVDLIRPIDWQKRIMAVDVELSISDDEFKEFVRMLRRIFRRHESLLTVADLGK